jgi:hypothetical protein
MLCGIWKSAPNACSVSTLNGKGNPLKKEKEYFIQKIEITPKRLEIGIHNVNKSSLKIKFYIYI